MEQFIQLNRVFYSLSADHDQSGKSDWRESEESIASYGRAQGSTIGWDELLQEYRVVLLAEAGAGKTQEIRHTAWSLRSKGKAAFFVRLEHIADGLEDAFEIGSHQEFQSWLNSNDEAWLLLDSVDESRLKDPKDFQNAVRKLSTRITSAINRLHIILTSRVSAWRPNTDLKLCNDYFPVVHKLKKKKDTPSEVHSVGFKVYSLVDLTKDQIQIFITAKGVNNNAKFIDELDRQDGWVFTTRPQDLEDVINFWNDEGRIGSRLELMRHSVKNRLVERDQDRAEYRPFTFEKAQYGVRLLAAACTFLHNSTIRVPDGSTYVKGVDAKSILTGWDDRECHILLSRPIFDEAIYGTVRFHHRSVREFLTAEWLFEQLRNDGSRQKIENVFFRIQYDQELITPSMKPVLAWLILFDSAILRKTYKLNPEIILECGDPGRIPLDIRREILSSICKKINLGISFRPINDYPAIQRFALEDMSDDITSLLITHKGNENVVYFLLLIIHLGQIKGTLLPTKLIALNPEVSIHNRMVAAKAVIKMGDKNDLNNLLIEFLTENIPRNRDLLAVLIDGLENNEESISWILKSLEDLQEKEKYGSDILIYSLLNFVERSSLNVVAKLIEGLNEFLRREPSIDRRNCRLSQKYAWLVEVSVIAVEKIIIQNSAYSFSTDSLFILIQEPNYQSFSGSHYSHRSHKVHPLVQEWRELKFAIFWETVKESRQHFTKEYNKPLTYFGQITSYKKYWNFDSSDFDFVVKEITSRPTLDDRLVALSLAFYLYKNNDCPNEWLHSIRSVVKSEEELKQRIFEFFQPLVPSEEVKKLLREDVKFKKTLKNKESKRQKEDLKIRKHLKKKYQLLRTNGLDKGHISGYQNYLFQSMQDIEGEHNRFSVSANWRGLIEEFGIEVSTAFRDGLVSYWRTHMPALRSEKDENNIPVAVLFGLSGIMIEANESLNWPQCLNIEEATIACRYAFRGLNEFPHWFIKLYEEHRDLVLQLAIEEIKWEVYGQSATESKDYVLSRVCFSCEWLWNSIAGQIFDMLSEEPLNRQNLSYLLHIIQGSSVIPVEELAMLAEKKCTACNSKQEQNIDSWYAVWIGIKPALAIKSLSQSLVIAHAQDKSLAEALAMKVVVNLLGGSRYPYRVKEAFKIPVHLKSLYVLMHQYIRVEEDIERANKGVCSPGLRDDAQDARDRIFSLLRNIPGKEAYVALIDLSKVHPIEKYRKWMLQYAKERADLDAEGGSWSVDKFIEFTQTLDSTPTNHRELFELGVQRLLDLKYELEEGDSSIASTLLKENRETGIRRYIANWCRDKAKGKYVIAQEEEFADDKRPDCRFLSSLFDAPVPMELKLANKWSGPALFERLENQLCGDYLRDRQSNRGVFVLVNQDLEKNWQLPNSDVKVTFVELIAELQNHWKNLSPKFSKIEQIKVIGIDLTRRLE